VNNQFVGDVGDYTKLGILRELEKAGFSIGINWYKTPDDPNKTGGSYTSFLNDIGNKPDPDLLRILCEIKEKPRLRTIEMLMNSGLFRQAKYYDVELEFYSDRDKKEKREEWHKQALGVLKSQDVVFLDPDNAFETKHIKPHHKRGNLYAGYDEAADYYKAGSSVIVYNHLPMRSSKEEFIKNRLRPVMNRLSANPKDIFYVEANRYQVRYYLFLSQPGHTDRVIATLDNMFEIGWGHYIEKYVDL